jgi:hypothetical protein
MLNVCADATAGISEAMAATTAKICAGSTIYLTVYVEGALLCRVGCHANNWSDVSGLI